MSLSLIKWKEQAARSIEEICRNLFLEFDKNYREHTGYEQRLKSLEGGTTQTTVFDNSYSISGTSEALSKIVSVTAGSNMITFPSPRTKDYNLILEFYDSEGTQITISPAPPTYTLAGFTITLDQPGFLKYVTIPKE